MGPLPGGERRVVLDVRTTETIDESRFVRRKISFASEPNDRVPAWLLIPKGGADKKPAMLCLHQTVPIGKDEPVGLGGKPNLRYAKELAERGYVALAPDYPNFGEHRVDVYALGYASASMKAIWDNLRGVDLLCGLEDVDPGRIGVIGHSLGGHNSIFTALFDPRIKAVVSSCGFNSFPEYYKGNIAGWSHKGYMPRLTTTYHLDLARVPFDFPELIGALAPRAFFTNSPLHDANFAVEGVNVCLNAAEPVYRLLGVGDRLKVVHPDAQHDFPPRERTAAYEFLDRFLQP
jgi:dienelactone hydrolase